VPSAVRVVSGAEQHCVEEACHRRRAVAQRMRGGARVARAWRGRGGAARERRRMRSVGGGAACERRRRILAAAAAWSGEHGRGGGVQAVEQEHERGSSRGEEKNVRLTRGAAGGISETGRLGPPTLKHRKDRWCRRQKHRCIHRCKIDQI
jgi:hypothetical protein